MPDATSSFIRQMKPVEASFRLFWLEQESERSHAELHPGVGGPRCSVGIRVHGEDRARTQISTARLLARHERRNCVPGLERSAQIESSDGVRPSFRLFCYRV